MSARKVIRSGRVWQDDRMAKGAKRRVSASCGQNPTVAGRTEGRGDRSGRVFFHEVMIQQAAERSLAPDLVGRRGLVRIVVARNSLVLSSTHGVASRAGLRKTGRRHMLFFAAPGAQVVFAGFRNKAACASAYGTSAAKAIARTEQSRVSCVKPAAIRPPSVSMMLIIAPLFLKRVCLID